MPNQPDRDRASKRARRAAIKAGIEPVTCACNCGRTFIPYPGRDFAEYYNAGCYKRATGTRAKDDPDYNARRQEKYRVKKYARRRDGLVVRIDKKRTTPPMKSFEVVKLSEGEKRVILKAWERGDQYERAVIEARNPDLFKATPTPQGADAKTETNTVMHMRAGGRGGQNNA